MATRTITLTGRPPVRIDEDNWPVIAKAADKTWDNRYECQANRTWKWWINVRQHEDGRTIVYAGYDHDSQFQGERDFTARAGKMLPADSSDETICETIREVCEEMASAESDADYTARWQTIAAECIADMPAEELT
jgi:hypothetical protein